MIRRPPRSTRTDTLFPYTTLFRSHTALGIVAFSQAASERPITISISRALRNDTASRNRSMDCGYDVTRVMRSEEHTSELQSLMRISYDGFCLKKKQSKNKT